MGERRRQEVNRLICSLSLTVRLIHRVISQKPIRSSMVSVCQGSDQFPRNAVCYTLVTSGIGQGGPDPQTTPHRCTRLHRSHLAHLSTTPLHACSYFILNTAVLGISCLRLILNNRPVTFRRTNSITTLILEIVMKVLPSNMQHNRVTNSSGGDIGL